MFTRLLTIRDSNLFRKRCRDFFECFWSQFQLFLVKIDLVFAVYRDQMDVCVRNFEPQHYYRYPFASYFLLDSACHLFCEYHHAGERFVVEVENIIDLLFRNNQRMSLRERIDVQKCVVAFVFGDFVARNFAGDDS